MEGANPRDMRRNVAVVLGDVGMAEDVPFEREAIEDPEPLVR